MNSWASALATADHYRPRVSVVDTMTPSPRAPAAPHTEPGRRGHAHNSQMPRAMIHTGRRSSSPLAGDCEASWPSISMIAGAAVPQRCPRHRRRAVVMQSDQQVMIALTIWRT